MKLIKTLIIAITLLVSACAYTDRISLDDGHQVCTLSYVNLLSPSITVARSCDYKDPIDYAASEDGIGGRVIDAGLGAVLPSILISDAIKSLRFPADNITGGAGGAAPTYNLNSNANQNLNAIIGGTP